MGWGMERKIQRVLGIGRISTGHKVSLAEK